MAEAARKRITLTTPKLSFRFPKLTEPDYGNEKFPKPDGEYAVQAVGRADDPAVKAFIAKLQPFYDEALTNAEAEFKKLKVDARKKLGSVKPNDLFTTLYDKETEEPTGEIAFKFAMKASGENKKTGKKWKRKPGLFDAKGVPITAPIEIWGGTIGIVSFTIEQGGYFIPGTGAAGLKMGLEAAQIIELRQGGAKDAKGYGFGEEEGYSANNRTDQFDNDDDTDTGNSSDEASDSDF